MSVLTMFRCEHISGIFSQQPGGSVVSFVNNGKSNKFRSGHVNIIRVCSRCCNGSNVTKCIFNDTFGTYDPLQAILYCLADPHRHRGLYSIPLRQRRIIVVEHKKFK